MIDKEQETVGKFWLSSSGQEGVRVPQEDSYQELMSLGLTFLKLFPKEEKLSSALE
jgi:hypothetical protein